MKRLIAMLLVIVFAFCACIGGSAWAEEAAPELTPKQIWTIQQTVDEFGDVTEGSETVICAEFSGNFSNTATSQSELTGVVFMRIGGGGLQYNIRKIGNTIYYNTIEEDRPLFTFRLFEYGGSTQTTYTDYDSISFKTKIDETITEYNQIMTMPPNGDLTVIDYGEILYNALYEGKDVRCIMEIGSSKYSFTLEAGNYSSIVKDADLLTESLYYRETNPEDIYNTAKELVDAGQYIEAADILVNIMDYPDSSALLLEAVVNEVRYNGNEIITDYWECLESSLTPLNSDQLRDVIANDWYSIDHIITRSYRNDGTFILYSGLGYTVEEGEYQIVGDTVKTHYEKPATDYMDEIIHDNKYQLYNLYGSTYLLVNLGGKNLMQIMLLDDKWE